jgi:hypothetical protein
MMITMHNLLSAEKEPKNKLRQSETQLVYYIV